jgi:hypothetical protein
LLWGQTPAAFTDVSDAMGLFPAGFHHAVAVADFDNDGWEDIYVGTTNGPNQLYWNQQGTGFIELAAEAGVADLGNTMAAVWLDYDNDGDADLATGNSNTPNRFYRNNGNGTFTDLTDVYGLGNTGNCRSINAADYNRDGWIDLYVTNLGSQNVLWHNLQGQGFQNVTQTSGALDTQIGMGTIFFDYDNDGDADLYLTHDANQANKLYRNNGNGTFTQQAVQAGLAHVGNCMGVDVADINHDGWLDVYITDLYPSELFLSDGDATFTPIGPAAGVDDMGMTWGCVWFDYDQDAEWDLYIVNDYLFSPDPNLLYRGRGDNTFEVVSTGNPALEHPYSDYGLAQLDFDRDGDRDLVIATSGSGSQPGVTLLRNDAATGHEIVLDLEGTVSNRDAVGARISCHFAGQTRYDEISAGQGYSGASTLEVHFGLGAATEVDSVVVRWPNGAYSTHGPFPAGSRQHLLEPGAAPWFSSGCTHPEACNYLPAATTDDGSCTYALLGTDCDGNPVPGGVGPDSHSIARVWGEIMLHSIRHDWARPTIHARNLWHGSVLMYDAWVAFAPVEPYGPRTYLLGREVQGFAVPFAGVVAPADEAARAEARRRAISYGMYRLLKHRFAQAPQASVILAELEGRMAQLGLDPNFTSTNYTTGDAEWDAGALGNYLAYQIIAWGLQDGSQEAIGYQNTYYNPVNWNLVMAQPGNPDMFFPNRWQPLQLTSFTDQGGNPTPTPTPEFLSPEWGNVAPFAMDPVSADVYERLGGLYRVFHDPGAPPFLDPEQETGWEDDYKWGHGMVALWSGLLSPEDGVMWNVSPAARGGAEDLTPTNFLEAREYYDPLDGTTPAPGHPVNPATGLPYADHWVPRGDYTRVLAEYWADGPQSETPPGHWFKLFHQVCDHPALERRWRGEGPLLDTLAWDVRGYFALGGALHDAAIAAWSIKGWYDYVRPVSALRWMADRGQSSDPEAPNYHGAGIPLLPGRIEQITAADPVELRGPNNEHLHKIKVLAWRGPNAVAFPAFQTAGVDWIRLENWWPYQRPTFVTPPFAGYISGHSTFSRAAAEVLTLMTGDEFFPGGLGEFVAPAGSYLKFEDGPSVDVRLQWATYRDAAEQSALSRIFGGIHPPQDDFPARWVGRSVGIDAFHCAETYMDPLAAPGFCGGELAGVCPGDLNADGVRNLPDLLWLLAVYGATPPPPYPAAYPGVGGTADLTGDGLVATADLLALLALWATPCF